LRNVCLEECGGEKADDGPECCVERGEWAVVGGSKGGGRIGVKGEGAGCEGSGKLEDEGRGTGDGLYSEEAAVANSEDWKGNKGAEETAFFLADAAIFIERHGANVWGHLGFSSQQRLRPKERSYPMNGITQTSKSTPSPCFERRLFHRYKST
jgi:hypothetical protein